MEKLKTAIPESLKRNIGDSHTDDLPLTCSSLLDFLLDFQPFHQMVKDLVEPDRALCVKNKDAALQWKQKGNRCFSSGDFANALDSYSQALRLAPLDADDMDKNLVATLFVNRASTLHKMNLLTESLRDCNRALQISPSYAKAWYRRGKVNAALGKYEDVSHDLDVAKAMEPSLGGKQQIESEQKLISNEYNSIISPPIQQTVNKSNILGQLQEINLQAVNVPRKGKGVVSTVDIPCSSLIHAEQPFAMIILKQCRETHCHYCLNELPPDRITCISCSRPWYCSQQCQLRAGGKLLQMHQKNYGCENLSRRLEKYVEEISLGSGCEVDTDHMYEHIHECQGVNWPAILPPEIVLAGRVLIKSVMKRGCSDVVNTGEMLELCHHYSKMSTESKLELHIYSTILLFCLQHSDSLEIQMNGESIAQIVIIVSQIRVNSMTIVRMKSLDSHEQVSQFENLSFGALTSNMKQVKAGQAIYKFGSLFNHSCQPNVHAYFLSRTLFIRTTEFVATGCPLELSYGPQVGQWDCKDRIKFLEDEYSFQCQCCCCSNINLSDLVLNAFRCVEPKCSGIVLDSCVFNCEKQKMKHCTRITGTSSLGSHSEVDNVKGDDIFKMVQAAFLQSKASFNVNPGYCFKCGSYRNIESSNGVVNKGWTHMKRLQERIVSEEVSNMILSDALRSLKLLRSTLHPYNRRIAEAEDILAQAFCSVGEFGPALDHCKASIEILEKLYPPNHIVIGHELVKLASIQLSLGDCTAVDNINRLNEIFSCYYGSHADLIFPNLQYLSREARQVGLVK